MKQISLLILLGLVQACDPYGFGFKNNPAFVVNEAFEAVRDLSPEAFIEISGKEALCIYGNLEGLAYLKSNLILNSEDFEIKPKLIENSSQYTNSPKFVGYWSYYNEKYQLDISHKANQAELLNVIVECNYGFEGLKSEGYQNLKLKKYKRKECRLIKIIPKQFEPLPLTEQCQDLSVDL